ncbi:MAG TPA: SDR family oxidoreductase [Devosia sp.]|jgi:3-oxoacyl-[acyl-carrier protein] reductase|uniref:SDR family oxidoreductase n=1 Tax=Devosia sp. TaxID=1871048 RepID=UPI002DDCC919|nr:SDR family oxidoreductase [Devosia sp.]HEV2515721.1 SDR family oxidoreductase [Devosia sp.]
MKLGLEHRKALVLGASKGLGAAIAISLANEGAQVIGASRSVDMIAALNGRLEPEATGRITGLPLDLTDKASRDALLQQVLAQGGVDILINNTGGPAPGEARSTGSEAWAGGFDAMVLSLIEITGALLPKMVERQWGRIVTLTSSGVESPIPRLAISNGLRAAVLGWSKTLAAEVAADGITANIIITGRIHTDRVDQLDAAAAQRQDTTIEAIRKASLATIPAGRYGKPEELADVVTFLASDRAGYVTGAKIRVDGGMIRSV